MVRRSQFGEEWWLGLADKRLCFSASPTEWGGLVCCPISSHTYKVLSFLHGQPSIGAEIENGYLSSDYLIERYLSWEGRGPENKRDMWGRLGVSDFGPVSAVRRTCYCEIKPGVCVY